MLVTVITGVYIQRPYSISYYFFRLFLHCLLKYSSSHIREIIVFDNNSPCNTQMLVSEWFPDENRIKIVKISNHINNIGSESISYDMGIYICKTEFAVYSHVDVILIQDAIKQHLEKTDKDTVIVGHIIGPGENQGDCRIMRIPQISSTFGLVRVSTWKKWKCSFVNNNLLKLPCMSFWKEENNSCIAYDSACSGGLAFYLQYMAKKQKLENSPLYIFSSQSIKQQMHHLIGFGEIDLILDTKNRTNDPSLPRQVYKYTVFRSDIEKRIRFFEALYNAELSETIFLDIESAWKTIDFLRSNFWKT